MSVLIQKVSAGERNGTESAGAVIEIQRVHLSVFLERAIGADGESAHQIGIAHGPVVDPHDGRPARSEEHTSELQSRLHLVCRLLLEKKKKTTNVTSPKRLTAASRSNTTRRLQL